MDRGLESLKRSAVFPLDGLLRLLRPPSGWRFDAAGWPLTATIAATMALDHPIAKTKRQHGPGHNRDHCRAPRSPPRRHPVNVGRDRPSCVTGPSWRPGCRGAGQGSAEKESRWMHRGLPLRRIRLVCRLAKADMNRMGQRRAEPGREAPGSIGTDGFGPRWEVHHGLVASSQDGEALANLPNPRACRRRPEVTRPDTVGPPRGSGERRFPDGFPSRMNTPGEAGPPDDGCPISSPVPWMPTGGPIIWKRSTTSVTSSGSSVHSSPAAASPRGSRDPCRDRARSCCPYRGGATHGQQP